MLLIILACCVCAVTPHTRCRLKLLKLERIKDFLLMEEELIRNQERQKPQEQKNEVSQVNCMCSCVCFTGVMFMCTSYSGSLLYEHPSTADIHDIPDNSESPDCPSIDFHTLPLNSGHPATPYNGQFPQSQL